MEGENELAVLRYIQTHWRGVPEHPAGMWITRHAPVPDDFDGVNHEEQPASAAWFLDEHGLCPRSPWEFRRFWVVQFVRPWCTVPSPGMEDVFRGRCWPIGVASFAECEGTGEVYLE